MLESIPAVTICLVLFAILMLLPFVEKIPCIGKVVSLRWAVVAVILTALIAVIVNFVALSDTVRETVIVGGLVIACLWIILRSVELWMYRGYILKAQKIELDMDDKKIVIDRPSIGKKKEQPKEEPKDEQPKDEQPKEDESAANE